MVSHYIFSINYIPWDVIDEWEVNIELDNDVVPNRR